MRLSRSCPKGCPWQTFVSEDSVGWETSQFAVNLSRSNAQSICMPLSSRTSTLIPSISTMQRDLESDKLLSFIENQFAARREGKANSLSLKNKTNIAFFVALITLAAIGWFSAQEESQHGEKKIRWFPTAGMSLRPASYFVLTFTMLRLRVERTALGRSNTDRYVQSGDKSALADFATLRKLTSDSPEQQFKPRTNGTAHEGATITLERVGGIASARLTMMANSRMLLTTRAPGYPPN